jgi:hypothetical protein
LIDPGTTDFLLFSFIIVDSLEAFWDRLVGLGYTTWIALFFIILLMSICDVMLLVVSSTGDNVSTMIILVVVVRFDLRSKLFVLGVTPDRLEYISIHQQQWYCTPYDTELAFHITFSTAFTDSSLS